jgi:signal transduction histidine kinase
MDSLALLGRTRAIETSVERDCPDVMVDPSLALEIIVNLVENAHRASPPEKSIELVARRHPVDDDRVRIEVLDRGPGVGDAASGFGELAPAIDDGDLPSRGLGLEIAKSLAAASGGSASLMSRPGGGAVARIDLPAASMLVAAEEQS